MFPFYLCKQKESFKNDPCSKWGTAIEGIIYMSSSGALESKSVL
jgi:hypothetical protein